MKIETILRASATPAARLAAWQNNTLASRRQWISAHYDRGATPAARRNAIIAATGPELSAPEADRPILWLCCDSDPLIADCVAGRDALNHNGWYADDMYDETLETYAVRLVQFPRLVFPAVMSCAGLRVDLAGREEIHFDHCENARDAENARQDCARDLIRDYDNATRGEAEEARDFCRAENIKYRIAEKRERLKTLRAEIRELCSELKTLCPSALAADYPAAGKAVLSALRALLSERRELMAENESLASSI